MATKQSQISFQTSTATSPIKRLIDDYGDNLELLSAAEKLHLLAVLALWQGRDTELSEDPEDQDSLGIAESYELAEAVEDYPCEFSGDVLAALKCLEGIEVDQVLDLIVAIACQVRDGVYQQ